MRRQQLPAGIPLVALAMSGALAACGGGSDDATTGSTPTTASRLPATRTCSTAGSAGVPSQYRRHALIVGDVVLGGLRDLSARTDASVTKGERHGAIESILVIPAGAEVTLSVPAQERDVVGLIYDGRKFRDDGAYRIADLDSSFRFIACRDRSFNHGLSQFDGVYVVAGRRCVQIDVAVPTRPVRQLRFPVGASCD